MPSPTQIRIERINALIEYFKDHNSLSIELIINHAQTLYPYTRPKTIFEYAEVAFNILRSRNERGT